MSQPLTADLVKATTGQYSISIKNIFSQAWQKVKGMKQSFWGGLILLFIILVGIYFLFQVGLFLIYTAFKLLGETYSVSPLVNTIISILQFVAAGFFEVTRLLLSISLVFLALKHLRNQVINSKMVFEFSRAWKPLTLLALGFYFLNALCLLGSRAILINFSQPGLRHILAIGNITTGIVFFFLFTYLAMLITMSMLLILDKNMSLKQSLSVAFKSINQHLFKNIALLLLASFVFMGFGILTLGIGLIWLLPFMALISAIQYQRIFCQSEVAFHIRKKGVAHDTTFDS